MITAGIDCGARNTKVVIVKDLEIIGKSMGQTGFDLKQACEETRLAAARSAGVSVDEIKTTAGIGPVKTGGGFEANLVVDEIEAMVTAARFFFPSARTVTDVGAQDGRTARMNERGKVTDSAVNEKCAAGAGMFIETIAGLIDREIDEMGPLALASDREIPMNAQCVIFAESEVIKLLHAETPVADISRAVHDAMADRIVTLISRIGVEKDFVMMGGIALNTGLVAFIKDKLRVSEILIPETPEYGAATGAALLAAK